MPNSIVDSATWTTPVTTIADGEAANAAAFALAPQALANRTAYLAANRMPVSGGSFTGAIATSSLSAGAITLTGGFVGAVTVSASVSTPLISGGTIALSSTAASPITVGARTVTTMLNQCPAFSAGTWTVPVVTPTYRSAAVTGGTIAYPVLVPNGSTLTSATVFLMGKPASHGALPATMPAMSMVANTITGSSSLIVSGSDTSAAVSSYEAVHAVTITCSSVVSTSSSALYLLLANEYGANSQDSLTVMGGKITYSLSAVPIE